MTDRSTDEDPLRALARISGATYRPSSVGGPQRAPRANAIARGCLASAQAPVQANTAASADHANDLFRPNYLIGRHAVSGVVYRVWAHGLDFTVGNSQFFSPDDTSRVRLRPLLPSDGWRPQRTARPTLPWIGTDANSLLWADHPDGDGSTIFLVSQIPRGILDSLEAIARASEYVRREYGATYPAAMALLP